MPLRSTSKRRRRSSPKRSRYRSSDAVNAHVTGVVSRVAQRWVSLRGKYRDAYDVLLQDWELMQEPHMYTLVQYSNEFRIFFLRFIGRIINPLWALLLRYRNANLILDVHAVALEIDDRLEEFQAQIERLEAFNEEVLQTDLSERSTERDSNGEPAPDEDLEDDSVEELFDI